MKQVIILIIMSIPLFASCDSIVKLITSRTGKIITRETSENITEGVTESTTKKIAKELAAEAGEVMATKTISKSLKELASSNKTLSFFYDIFQRRINQDFADNIMVSIADNGISLISKDFPNSAIRVNKNIVIGKAGSTKISGHVNEFFNYLLPNKSYMVDDAFIYNTDNLGRVVNCSADRTKAYRTIERNSQRNSSIQNMVIDILDGRKGYDDAGHLFANNTGGPNELINQVPMSSSLNRHGKWRELEMIEENALKEGKSVISKRNLLYRDKAKRPYAIEFVSIIDGIETRTLIENI